jgi:hypothetical protein
MQALRWHRKAMQLAPPTLKATVGPTERSGHRLRLGSKTKKGLSSILLNSPSIETSVLALAFVSDLLLQSEPGKQKIQKTVLTTGRRRLSRNEPAL